MAASGAQRQAACRRRQRDGLMLLTIGVPDTIGDALAHAGFLPGGDTEDREQVAHAIERLIAALLHEP